MADFALNVNIGQEMHLDFDKAATFAIFASAAFDIETETAGIISAHTRRRQLRKELADRRECACISDRVRARCAPDGALVDDDGFVNLFDPTQVAESSRSFLGIVELAE